MVQGTCVTPPEWVKAISETVRSGCRRLFVRFLCGGLSRSVGGRFALCAFSGARVEEFAFGREVRFPRIAILLDQSLEVGIVAQAVEVSIRVDVVEIGVLSAL